ncbi:hypothetical protein D5086_033903 [Populus alba]|uniref:Uncharacterized protein n=1 Tax=Populus alba TaxID=43335 RepID=A0ACC4AI60_POPAL
MWLCGMMGLKRNSRNEAVEMVARMEIREKRSGWGKEVHAPSLSVDAEDSDQSDMIYCIRTTCSAASITTAGIAFCSHQNNLSKSSLMKQNATARTFDE